MHDLNRTRTLRAKSAHVRRVTLEMIRHGLSGHPGSSLSIVEILTTLHYYTFMKDPSTSYFYLSKGHGAPALYAIMILQDVLPTSMITRLRQGGSPLQGHPDERYLPSLACSSGSLGQGLSIAVGRALGQRSLGRCAQHYVVIGDGEAQEGQVWEASMAAAHLGLDNLTLIVDNNGLQLDGAIKSICDVGSLHGKWEAFGWDVIPVDGHDVDALADAFDRSRDGRPRCVIAHTTKGKGVSFMENVTEWHSIHDPVHAQHYLDLAVSEAAAECDKYSLNP